MKKTLIPLAAFSLFLSFLNPCWFCRADAQPASEVEDILPVVGLLVEEDAQRDEALTAQMVELVEAGNAIEAIEPCREQLELRRGALGDDDPLTLEALQNLGVALAEHESKYAEAEPLLRQALAGWERLLDEKHPRRLAAMNALGHALNMQNKFEEAEPLFVKALAGRRQVFGKDHEKTLNSVYRLGALYKRMGQLEKAEPYYREAMENSQVVLGEDHPATMTFQNNMGHLLDRMGRYAEAEVIYRKNLEDRRRFLGREHRSTASTCNNLGALLVQLNQYEEAESFLRTAMETNRRLLGDEHPSTLSTIANLGLVIKLQGRFTEAEVLMREAMTTNRKVLGEDHSQTLTTILNLAGLLKAQGRMAEAEALQLEALEGDRRTVGDRHPNTLSSMHNLARLLEYQGRVEEAAEVQEITLRNRRQALGPEHPQTLRTLDSLGILRYRLGEYGEAESLLRQALDTRRRVLEQGHPEVCDSQGNLGLVLEARGNLGEAEQLYQHSLDGYRRALGQNNPRTLSALGRMGHLHLARGEFQTAEGFFRKELDGRRRVLGDDHPDVMLSLNSLARLKAGIGEYQAAESLWRESAAVFETARLRVSAGGLERAYFAEQVSPLAPLAACLARNKKPGPAWSAFEENQARGLLDAISARYARSLTAAERDRESSLIGKLSRLEEKLGAAVGAEESAGGEFERLRGEQVRLQAELARFQAELAERYGPAAGEVFELDRIRKSLPENAALVGWVDIAAGPHAADPNGEHWACAVRRTGAPAWVRLAGSGEGGAWTEADDGLTSRVRQILGRPQRRSALRRNRAILDRLKGQRLAPLLPHLGDVEHLIVLPAGAMSGIPIEALDASFTVSYAPSGTMYAWLREKRAPAASPLAADPPRLLALGDPDFGSVPGIKTAPAELPDHGVLVAMVMDDSAAYRGGIREGDVLLSYGGESLGSAADLGPVMQKVQNAQPAGEATENPPVIPITVWRDGETHELELSHGRLGLRPSQEPMPEALLVQREMDAALGPTRHQSFRRLPGSRREVETIAGLFQTAGESKSSNEVLLGQEASEQRLAELSTAGTLKQFGVIHLATHGVMNDRMALQSALILARTVDQSAGGMVYDGRLTGEQIVRTWDLDAELVTLSGCETALGRETGGEGYLGFSQAMFIAGARSLLLSLWKVNDQATMLLMTRFYENVLGKFPEQRIVGDRRFRPGQRVPRALALQEAKQWLANVTGRELRSMGAELADNTDRGPGGDAVGGAPGGYRPFADPHFWAAFILLGDPG